MTASISSAEDAKIWEFSPYEVEFWYAFDSTLHVSTFARQRFLSQLEADLERAFQAAWNVRFNPVPPNLAHAIGRNFDDFSVEDMAEGELLLVASLRNEQAKIWRTFEGLLESSSEIYCAAATKEQLQSSASHWELPSDSPTLQLIDKCVTVDGGVASIQERLRSATIGAALVPRSLLPQIIDDVRPLVTLLPWQTDHVFRERDKLFFMLVGMQGDDFTFQVRELDCPMQFLGPAMQDATADWSFASRVATSTAIRAFAPVARVEDAESKTAVLRLRAGGLIVDDDNPAAVHIGDVMQPVVRRDDRNGIPTLLTPLPWTFAAITASDGVTMHGNVYSYSNGPGLQGQRNRRTQRMLLRVRPLFETTDIRLTVRGDGRPLSGCFVYRRDLLTEEFAYLGRTDWRGRLTIPVPAQFGGVLPEEVRYRRYLKEKKAAAQADVEQQAAEESGNSDATSADTQQTSLQAAVASDPNADPEVLPLNSPLTMLYIKNGDEVLAKLPIVPGLKEVETAELKDDVRRLKAEAFVVGFQGEVLDLIGLRNLLAARIRLHLKGERVDEAESTLEELRRLPNYNDMADKLERIQRGILDEKEGVIPIVAKNRIDRMFQTTRNMLQKYMQDNLLSESARAVTAAR